MKLFRTISVPQVEKMFRKGMTIRQIADSLCVAEGTIYDAVMRIQAEWKRNTWEVIERAERDLDYVNPPGDGGINEVKVCVSQYP